MYDQTRVLKFIMKYIGKIKMFRILRLQTEQLDVVILQHKVVHQSAKGHRNSLQSERKAFAWLCTSCYRKAVISSLKFRTAWKK